MSKIGKRQLKIPEGVTVEQKDGSFVVKGPKGELNVLVLPYVEVAIGDGGISAKLAAESKQAHANWGTTIALLDSAITGVTNGFEKALDIEGVGFRAMLEGKDLVLHVGYSHPVKFPAPEGITFTVEKNSITVRGIDKYLVGQTAANIRAIKKPEPYKCKGIRYRGEVIIRKAGKKVAGTTG